MSYSMSCYSYIERDVHEVEAIRKATASTASPGQTESQPIASFNLAITDIPIWPGLNSLNNGEDGNSREEYSV